MEVLLLVSVGSNQGTAQLHDQIVTGIHQKFLFLFWVQVMKMVKVKETGIMCMQGMEPVAHCISVLVLSQQVVVGAMEVLLLLSVGVSKGQHC